MGLEEKSEELELARRGLRNSFLEFLGVLGVAVGLSFYYAHSYTDTPSLPKTQAIFQKYDYDADGFLNHFEVDSMIKDSSLLYFDSLPD